MFGAPTVILIISKQRPDVKRKPLKIALLRPFLSGKAVKS